MSKITMCDILKDHGGRYVSKNKIKGQQKEIINWLSYCRTQALGSHPRECDHCFYFDMAYNSCRNRHYPNCQHKDSKEWLNNRMQELLPVGYYHLVFTIPHQLNPLCQQNKKVMYGSLFKATSQTLLELSKDARHLGADTGISRQILEYTNNNMRKTIQLLLATTILFLTVSCNQIQRHEKLTIKIVETSDVHGAIFPYDLMEDKATDYSLAWVLTYVGQERANSNLQVTLLENGDILQGDPIVYYYNFKKTENEHICTQAMNYMGYDAATVGNHDIEPGHAVYDKVNNEFDFPWLAANAVDKEAAEPYF